MNLDDVEENGLYTSKRGRISGPDSRKILIVAGQGGESGGRKMFRTENTVDYYDREKSEPGSGDFPCFWVVLGGLPEGIAGASANPLGLRGCYKPRRLPLGEEHKRHGCQWRPKPDHSNQRPSDDNAI